MYIYDYTVFSFSVCEYNTLMCELGSMISRVDIRIDECVSQLLCCLQVAYEAERGLLHSSLPLILRC